MTAADGTAPASVGPGAAAPGRLTILRRAFLLVRVGLAGTAFLGTWLGALVLAAIVFPLARLRHRRATAMERAAVCQRWL